MALSPPPTTTSSYAQWIRRTIRRNSTSRSLLVSLFESSVPEPTELMREVIQQGFEGEVSSRYASTFLRGNPYLVAALAQYGKVREEQVLTTTGATGALSLIYRALLQPGERILVENPGFDIFSNIARSIGTGVDRFERPAPSFAIEPDRIEAALTPQTRIVVLSNLHNPSGEPIANAVFAELAQLAERRDLIIVFDEVYGPYARDEFQPAASLGLSDRFLSVNSLSKIFGLSTLRCGWIIGDERVLAPIRDLASETEFAISNLSHAVAALIVENPQPFIDNTFEVLRRSRPIIESYHEHWLAEGLVCGSLPRHGCIAFPRLIGIDDTLHFSDWLSDRCGVVVAPGDYFGLAGHIRLGFAMKPSQLDYGLQALTDSLLTYRDDQRAGIEHATVQQRTGYP